MHRTGGSLGLPMVAARSLSCRQFLFVKAMTIFCGALLVMGLTTPMAHAVDEVFVVNSDNDVSDGTCDVTHCSLREAITASNAASDTNTINFSIGSGLRHYQCGICPSVRQSTRHPSTVRRNPASAARR